MKDTAQRINRVNEMRGAYPSLRFVSDENTPSLVWEGWLQPIRSTEELDLLLDDLENDRDVEVVRGDYYTLTHDQQCSEEHDTHRLRNQIGEPIRLFKIRIEDFYDDRLPEARVIEPKIPREERRHNRGPDGICSFAPWKHPWSKDDSIVEFVDQALIWMLKQTVYSQTQPREWLGSETQHDTAYLFSTIKATDQCYCGSSRNYENCHRIVNGKELFGKVWITLEAWLMAHNENPKRFHQIVNKLQQYESPKSMAAHAQL